MHWALEPQAAAAATATVLVWPPPQRQRRQHQQQRRQQRPLGLPPPQWLLPAAAGGGCWLLLCSGAPSLRGWRRLQPTARLYRWAGGGGGRGLCWGRAWAPPSSKASSSRIGRLATTDPWQRGGSGASYSSSSSSRLSLPRSASKWTSALHRRKAAALQLCNTRWLPRTSAPKLCPPPVPRHPLHQAGVTAGLCPHRPAPPPVWRQRACGRTAPARGCCGRLGALAAASRRRRSGSPKTPTTTPSSRWSCHRLPSAWQAGAPLARAIEGGQGGGAMQPWCHVCRLQKVDGYIHMCWDGPQAAFACRTSPGCHPAIDRPHHCGPALLLALLTKLTCAKPRRARAHTPAQSNKHAIRVLAVLAVAAPNPANPTSRMTTSAAPRRTVLCNAPCQPWLWRPPSAPAHPLTSCAMSRHQSSAPPPPPPASASLVIISRPARPLTSCAM